MEQPSRVEFKSLLEPPLCQEDEADAGTSRCSNRCSSSRQNQMPAVIENLGRVPPFESNQENLESAGLTVGGFEAPQAQVGGFGLERGAPGFEPSFAHRRSPQCAYRQFESPKRI